MLGALQGGILGIFLLFVKSENTRANYILATLIFVFSVNLILEVLYDSGEYVNWPMLIGLDTPIDFLYGPLLWFYTSTVIQDANLSLKKQFWQFIPAILIVVLWSEFYFSPPQEKVAELSRLLESDRIEPETAFYWILTLIHGMSYSCWVVVKVRRFQLKIKQTRSQIDGINLQWLIILTSVIGILWLGATLQVGLLIYQVEVSSGLLMMPTVGIVFVIYLIGYLAMRQPAIFKGETEKEIKESSLQRQQKITSVRGNR